ncbi:hypothetical protein QUW35_05845 [Ligilactobacillus agilis]|uniref:hypothetical protein n=1 Tax=Ligilactobacillus agilis TaxID=1601 RepID=UPI0025A41981|nr:hypothetical protein [Ligilactobacillus agilis]MDM8280207.1 hypothetical protein [Ligilactobacillus agilis]
MKIYSYPKAVKSDIREYLNDNLDVGTFGLLLQGDDDTIEDVREDLFEDDSVTGNQSGSYTMNSLEAEQNLAGNWDLLQEAKEELDPGVDLIAKGPEFCDVLIRCYLVDWCFNETLNDIVNQKEQ